jgi:protease-4
MGLLALLPLAGFCAEQEKTAKDEKKTTSSTKSMIPVFNLASGLSESPEEVSFSLGDTPVSLKDLVARMKKAAADPGVIAVVLSPGDGLGGGQIEEIRQAMSQIRAAGKDVYVHADSLSMGQYVLASGATRISLVPTADLWLTGLYGEAPYVRGLLDKIGVKPDFLHCGDYKSAAEIFMRDGPSPEAEKMQNWLLDSVYNTEIKLIATGRAVDADKVKKWIDSGPYTALKAKEAGLIDAVEQRQDFEALLKNKYGREVVFNKKYGHKPAPKLDFSSPFAIFKIMGDLVNEGQKKKTGKDAIAVVYVDGPILLGTGKASLFGMGGAHSSDIRKALDETARDDSIKAVVLRVDSPGGSAVASEIILDATRRVKAKKPFVVSMGNVAGSGGYYVSCASDVIFADETTITASIGVVGGKIATNDAWKKIGVTFKAYQRGENAAMLSSADVFTKEEKVKMQAWMDDIYAVFKGHVTSNRGDRLKKPIDELAGGRVFTGQQALELGLVDKIGSLQDAIDHVATKTKLTDYDVRVVPEPKNILEKLLEQSAGDKDDSPGLNLTAPFLVKSRSISIIDLAVPHLRHLDPERVGLIMAALQRLQMIQSEGAILMMPEMRIGN